MTVPARQVEDFIARWQASGANERANFQTFIGELTALLDLEPVKVADAMGRNNDYRFERPVRFVTGGEKKRGLIDLYRKQCFVMEGKQGYDDVAGEGDAGQLSLFGAGATPALPRQRGHGRRGTTGFDQAMFKARNMGDRYARAVAKEDGWPPFLIIVDVGSVIELYADFSGQGHGYNQFPDGNGYRIFLTDLLKQETRTLLRKIWCDPFSLDPSLEAAEVTRGIAVQLAALGRSLEGQGVDSETAARFLMRCLFSMFAEDVDLIPPGSFSGLLKKLRGHPEDAVPALRGLWETMNTGGFSQGLMQSLKRFNGGLFREADALPLDALQLGLLIQATEADWKQVEPAIFGTLLERALDKRQRHKLGAHYTPRAYVQRLVIQTVIEPLRDDWKIVQVAVQRRVVDGRVDDAVHLVRDFHLRLCDVRILDPACGSGNFLYVALEMMKRLEGEVISLMVELGDTRPMITVDPHQFLGIELNPWAANVAELVLWIGYLQWHYRTHGQASPSEPVLRDFHNIKCADALLEWDERVARVDESGRPVTRWDGATTMCHPVTGEEVPDPAARVQVYDYAKPEPTAWPRADFIVGNPPFIGASRLRDSLGDGYVEALWKAYPGMPQSADLVMFWWDKAARAARTFDTKMDKGTRRFGLITTNSLRQIFNRRVLGTHLNDQKKPLSLLYAIPDHPWVDTLYGAAVRIAMTVGGSGRRDGRLLTIATETRCDTETDGRQVTFDQRIGKIFANLQIGADVMNCSTLASNKGLAHMGMKLHGAGFIITKKEAETLADGNEEVFGTLIRPYMTGRDLAQSPRGLYSIDLYPLSEDNVRTRHPKIYQHVRDTVKPERDQNNREGYRKNWWLFGEPRKDLRTDLVGLKRCIATTRTAKHRLFSVLPSTVIAESGIVVISLEDGWQHAVLSSRIHVVFSLAAGGWLGFGNDPTYNHSNCFNKFPFPDLAEDQKDRLRSLGEELDAHRKRQQAAHPKLTLTRMYNVLEKLRAGEAIEGKDREIYDQGLIGILKDLHDQIDAAVAEAYGWPAEMSDEDILFRLVALSRERAEEEARGHIRWLRPDYQNPTGRQAAGAQAELDMGFVAKVEKASWPNTLPDQIAVVHEALAEMGEATPEQIARRFRHARTSSVQPLLESLATLGQAQRLESNPADPVLYGAP